MNEGLKTKGKQIELRGRRGDIFGMPSRLEVIEDLELAQDEHLVALMSFEMA